MRNGLEGVKGIKGIRYPYPFDTFGNGGEKCSVARIRRV